jgi:hypothetical protein
MFVCLAWLDWPVDRSHDFFCRAGSEQLVTPLVINLVILVVFFSVFLACRRRRPNIFQVRSCPSGGKKKKKKKRRDVEEETWLFNFNLSFFFHFLSFSHGCSGA